MPASVKTPLMVSPDELRRSSDVGRVVNTGMSPCSRSAFSAAITIEVTSVDSAFFPGVAPTSLLLNFDTAVLYPKFVDSGELRAAIQNYAYFGQTGLETGGPPALGNQSFALNVQNAAAAAPSALFLGQQSNIPIFGCTLLTLPAPTGSIPFVVGPDLPFPIPCANNILNVQLAMQWIILDAGGPQGLSMSDGMLLTF